jgi:MOSC domain-containing protein YiiM
LKEKPGMANIEMKEMMNTMPQVGKVEWIGLRQERRGVVLPSTEVDVMADLGLRGDHHSKAGGKRQITLIQAEHIEAAASVMGMKQIDPALLRRNIVVRGLNLVALKDHRFTIGSVIFETTGECHPCSRMEENLGPGGYNAMRGHGGITARILSDGTIAVGDSVKMIPNEHEKD